MTTKLKLIMDKDIVIIVEFICLSLFIIFWAKYPPDLLLIE